MAILKAQLKRQLRYAQTWFPLLRGAKFSAWNFATRRLGWKIEPEFRLLPHLPQCDLAIDVGGSWGQSILALKRWARPRRVLSFEPNPELVARLQRRYCDDPSVEIEAMALGLREGPYELLIPSYRGLTNTIFLTDEQRSAMPCWHSRENRHPA